MHNYSFRVVFITGTFTHITVNTYIHIVFWIMTLCCYMIGVCQSLEEHSASIIGAEIFNVKSVGNMIL